MNENEVLRMDVMEGIKSDPDLRKIAAEIGVSAKDGIVILSGYVDSYRTKIATESAAQIVPGVAIVVCNIEVRVRVINKKGDLEIAETIKQALDNTNISLENKIRIKVDGRWVYLDGQTCSREFKNKIEHLVQGVSGIRGMTSNISVTAHPINNRSLQHQIASAFHNIAAQDARSIKVNVEGSRITLSGCVRSLAEKNHAESVAKKLQGISEVDNRIVVEG